MICKKCNREITDTVSFCPHCGTAVNDVTKTTVSTSTRVSISVVCIIVFFVANLLLNNFDIGIFSIIKKVSFLRTNDYNDNYNGEKYLSGDTQDINIELSSSRNSNEENTVSNRNKTPEKSIITANKVSVNVGESVTFKWTKATNATTYDLEFFLNTHMTSKFHLSTGIFPKN